LFVPALYLGASVICLIRLFWDGASIQSSVPLVLITEPWSTLLGSLCQRFVHDLIVDYYSDQLNAFAIGVFILSGIINASLLWILSRWFNKSN
jgi:hypothetical protein